MRLTLALRAWRRRATAWLDGTVSVQHKLVLLLAALALPLAGLRRRLLGHDRASDRPRQARNRGNRVSRCRLAGLRRRGARARRASDTNATRALGAGCRASSRCVRRLRRANPVLHSCGKPSRAHPCRRRRAVRCRGVRRAPARRLTRQRGRPCDADLGVARSSRGGRWTHKGDGLWQWTNAPALGRRLRRAAVQFHRRNQPRGNAVQEKRLSA